MKGAVASFIDDGIARLWCDAKIDISHGFGCERINMYPCCRVGMLIEFLKIAVQITAVRCGSAEPCVKNRDAKFPGRCKDSPYVWNDDCIQAFQKIAGTARIKCLGKRYQWGCRLGVVTLDIDHKNGHCRKRHDANHYAPVSAILVYE